MLLNDEVVNELATRLEIGVPATALPLIKVNGLTRSEMLLLHRYGVTQPETGWSAVAVIVEAALGTERAQQLATIWPERASSLAA
ncbi:hypothetical protein FNT36_16530 [Hymenobacter setariae]|uniref:Uncharacterized protein n=1 Tax=Hymenobacter setariae TaxID=2594794 RepID=A0A558BRY5_9BACT|nr:hypothetical protein [Hymenobacter setariae]TVT39263.1 hypothetical protein FNT36_16530 [Hymenobacter setariae]